MILTRLHIVVIIIFANPQLSLQNSEIILGHETINTTDTADWRRLEALAEEHPYVVALLSAMKDYICTGSVINKVCILTSGHCITYEPKYVAVNTAVYNKKLNNKTIFNIAGVKLHGDYIFQLKTADPNVTRMHSNIGLVYVDRPLLEYFINVADLGNFYASELKDKQLLAIGYGNLGTSNLVGLQYQVYQQTPCMNPKWYYCVCGVETTPKYKTYTSEFGKGGPVLLGSAVVGISAAASGTLFMRNLEIKYNVFTVLGPYLPWIEKSKEPESYDATLRSKGASILESVSFKHFHTLIVMSKIFF